jgi:hypothetical protein
MTAKRGLRRSVLTIALLFAAAAAANAQGQAESGASGAKPNILVIFGDDIGICQYQRL